MLELDGKYYFTDVEHILDKLNVEVTSISGDNLMMCCPFHKERKPSFGIHKETGQYNCFSCNTKGDILSFIGRILNIDRKESIKYISQLATTERVAPRINIPIKNPKSTQYEYTRYIDYIGYKYFHSRNITRKTVDMFNLGTEKGEYVVFPIRDKEGTTLAVQKRHIKTKKFLFPTGFNIKHYIFGLYELYKYGDKDKPVIVCESVIDALTCWEYGYQGIAIYSAMISVSQLELLVKSPFRLFKDGFDRDTAGRLGWKVFKEQAIPKGLRVIESKEHSKKDINELSYGEFLAWIKCY